MSHDDIARRWQARTLGDTRPAIGGSRANLLDRGDSIFSYGSHFEVGRVLRDRKGQPTGYLLNGNTYSNTTSKHQAAVRQAVFGHGLPVVTIPYAALEVAGIDLSSVQVVEVQRDWNTETVITRQDMPGRWVYDSPDYDMGGWQNSRTGEWFGRLGYSDYPPRIVCDCAEPRTEPRYGSAPWEEYKVASAEYEAHMRLRHGEWEEVRAHRRETGRKTVRSGVNGGTVWDLVDDPEAPLGYVFERVQRRHWLGASLITAKVNYRVNQRHEACSGTGVAAEPWVTLSSRDGLGPLTADDMALSDKRAEWAMERNGGIRQPQAWSVDTYVERTECRGCSGRGRVPANKQRTAYFLSGFDQNETRPSYFFCELPPKARPTTVDEALESLKPDAVKLAEQAGRDVKRQGDIFAIPMPSLTLRELKAQGGVHIRKPKLKDDGGRTFWDGPRPQLLGTNHEATEIVILGGQTYGRGTIKHVPDRRRPDHKQLTIGREWHLIVKNTVPIGA